MKIHLVTSIETKGYHAYCIDNHISLADHPEKLSFVSHCLDAESYHSIEQNDRQSAIKTQGGRGSGGHAVGIQSILANLSPGEINVVTDTDCVLLVKGWDTILNDLMKEYKIVGTTYEDIGGFSSGDSLTQTFKRIPNFTWVALSPEYDWKFDASCDKHNNLQIDTQELSETFNLPIGYNLFREPIWRLPVYIRENNIRHLPLKFVRPTSGDAKAILTGQDYHTEYQLNDGTPFVAHQRGSMSKAFRSHPLSSTFYDACDNYLSRMK